MKSFVFPVCLLASMPVGRTGLQEIARPGQGVRAVTFGCTTEAASAMDAAGMFKVTFSIPND